MYDEQLRTAHLVLNVLCGLSTTCLALMVIKGLPIARKDPEGFDQSWLNVGILFLNLVGFMLILAQALTGDGKVFPIVLVAISLFPVMDIHGWARLVGFEKKNSSRNDIAAVSMILLFLSNTALITVY